MQTKGSKVTDVLGGDVFIQVRRAGVRYPNGQVGLDGVSFQVRRGEFVVLLGASGAGKSTLLRSINGLVDLTEGEVSISDLPEGLGRRERLQSLRRLTGMVFQQHHLIGRLNALDNVLVGALGARSGWRAFLPWTRTERVGALAALDRVGLMDRALHRADSLSGGQQQRVGIARALVQQPRLLLADEPVASLDPATAENVLTLIHGICKSDGLTALISLHQIDLARRFADRIIGVAAGRKVFDIAPGDLTEAVASRLYGPGGSSPDGREDSLAAAGCGAPPPQAFSFANSSVRPCPTAAVSP